MTAPETGDRDPIREGLRHLPRTVASDDFNRRLLERAKKRPSRGPSVALRIAAALVLAVLTTALWLTYRHGQRQEQEQQRAAIEQGRQELRRDLALVRERAVRSPTLYLGSASDYDLVLDLDPWMQQPLAIEPAVYTGTRP